MNFKELRPLAKSVWKILPIAALPIVGLGLWWKLNSSYLPEGLPHGSMEAPNLKDLEVLELPPGVDRVDWLPSRIKILKISGAKIRSLKGLPSSLRELDASYTGIRSLDSIPKNLRALDIRGTRIRHLVGFPPKLESLKVANQDIYRLGKLPASLRDLYLGNTRIHDLVGLPPRLRTLYVEGESLNNLDDLPGTLQSLTLVATNVESLKSLPPSLQVLKLIANRRLRFQAEDLPPLLTWFEADLDQPSPDLSGLRYLSWYSDRRPTPSRSFPSFLSSLTLRAPGWTEFPNFPSSLRALGLLSTATVPLEKLPPELEVLDLTGYQNKGLGSLKSLTRLKTLQLGYSDLSELPILPTGLERLELSGTSIINFQILPSGLKELIFCDSRLTQLDGDKDLPHSLMTLDLCNSRDLKELSVPKQLTHLSIGGTGIEKLPTLGASLTYLDISNTKIKIMSAHDLPGSLVTLIVSEDQVRNLADIPSHVKNLCFTKRLTLRNNT